MSHTTLLGVRESDGEIEAIDEYRNGWGAAPFVWNIIYNQRRGISAMMVGMGAGGKGMSISPTFIPQCNESEGWALALTLDFCIVKREDAAVVAQQLRAFLASADGMEDKMNHWPKIAAVLDDMPAGYLGIAINHTSCSYTPLMLSVTTDDREYDRPYSVHKDSDHFFLTEKLMQEWAKGDDQ